MLPVERRARWATALGEQQQPAALHPRRRTWLIAQRSSSSTSHDDDPMPKTVVGGPGWARHLAATARSWASSRAVPAGVEDRRRQGQGPVFSRRGLARQHGMRTRRVNPREEWRAGLHRRRWRRHRDFFYVENMHGVDWDAVYDGATTRCSTTPRAREDVIDSSSGR